MTKREEFARETLKVIVTAVIATAGASWTARGMVADFDKRVTVLETHQAMEGSVLNEIRTDLREVRAAVMDKSRGQ